MAKGKAKSRSQQRLAGMAVAARKGKLPKRYSAALARMSRLKKESLLKIARTKHAGLPEKVAAKERLKSNRKKLT
ncbi:MAG TPA: DUF3008 family protein [Candidatus Paceibacterota bacterium]|nr:DUF3008 family protein [Candidatus Paceibacterota bacterium]